MAGGVRRPPCTVSRRQGGRRRPLSRLVLEANAARRAESPLCAGKGEGQRAGKELCAREREGACGYSSACAFFPRDLHLREREREGRGLSRQRQTDLGSSAARGGRSHSSPIRVLLFNSRRILCSIDHRTLLCSSLLLIDSHPLFH